MASLITMRVESERTKLGVSTLPRAIGQELRPALEHLGRTLQEDVRGGMRKDRGAERRNVKRRVTGTLARRRLLVWGDLAQTRVDEEGRARGARMPPHGKGAPLFAWVGRKGLVDRIAGRKGSRASRQQSAAFVVARGIARKGIPARRPFARALERNRSLIYRTVSAAVNRAGREL